MRILLKNVPVVTESGVSLGRVFDVEVISPDMRVTRLDVRQGIVMPKKFFIDASQIVRVESGRIVVQDGVLTEPLSAKAQELAMPNRAAIEPMSRVE